MENEKVVTSNSFTVVANFSSEKRDGFSNTVKLHLEQKLPDDTFSVRSCEFQDQNIERYSEFIADTYFKNNCDTSGLFINGFIDKEDEKTCREFVAKVRKVAATVVVKELS